MKFRYTPEMLAFLRAEYRRVELRPLTAAFNLRFRTLLPPTAIRAALRHYRPRLIWEAAHGPIPAGHVAWQDPPAGMVLPENTAVTYAISSGPAPIPVPDVIGFTRTHAERVLAAAGLRRGTVDTVAADPEAGVVIATRPAAGTGRARGDRVDLVVSGRALPGAVLVPALHIAPLGGGPR